MANYPGERWPLAFSKNIYMPYANSIDLDQTPRVSASGLGQQYLLLYYLCGDRR